MNGRKALVIKYLHEIQLPIFFRLSTHTVIEFAILKKISLEQ